MSYEDSVTQEILDDLNIDTSYIVDINTRTISVELNEDGVESGEFSKNGQMDFNAGMRFALDLIQQKIATPQL